jgi:hypothetical protein
VHAQTSIPSRLSFRKLPAGTHTSQAGGQILGYLCLGQCLTGGNLRHAVSAGASLCVYWVISCAFFRKMSFAADTSQADSLCAASCDLDSTRSHLLLACMYACRASRPRIPQSYPPRCHLTIVAEPRHCSCFKGSRFSKPPFQMVFRPFILRSSALF